MRLGGTIVEPAASRRTCPVTSIAPPAYTAVRAAGPRAVTAAVRVGNSRSVREFAAHRG